MLDPPPTGKQQESLEVLVAPSEVRLNATGEEDFHEPPGPLLKLAFELITTHARKQGTGGVWLWRQ